MPLPRDKVDTDAIIPAAYMRSLATDPARGLFARWRYGSDGREDPGFALNDPRFRGAAILLSGAHFGCGSSRENAVWALRNAGFRCIIAQGFSDIFHENCFKNAVLPIVAAPHEHAALMQSALRDAPWSVTIDLEARTLRPARRCDGLLRARRAEAQALDERPGRDRRHARARRGDPGVPGAPPERQAVALRIPAGWRPGMTRGLLRDALPSLRRHAGLTDAMAWATDARAPRDVAVWRLIETRGIDIHE